MAGSVLTKLILDVQDLDRSLRFYGELLEIDVVNRNNMEGHRLAWLISGNTELVLLQQPISEQNPALDRRGGMLINFQVKGLPALTQQLMKEGVTVLRDLDMALWGERTFLIADPDGYAVLLSEPVETVH
ncbi:MAG: VOC family protein [Fimbriimonadaceae bacterium]